MSRYMRVQRLFHDALGQASLILTQSKEDARRYTKFDLATKIIVSGNTKIEAPETEMASEEAIRPELMAFASGRKIFVAGSTAPGEDAIDRERIP